MASVPPRPGGGPGLSRRLEQAASRLSTSAVRRMEELAWFQALPAAQRADVGLVVQASLAVFGDWLHDPDAGPPAGPDVFSAAPSELARHISLKQTVQLIRIMVEVVEEHVPQLAEPADVPLLTEHVLRYSREIAFAAAEVYAAAAEARGAWDARVEAGVVEALVRGSVGELTTSRATSLGWSRTDWVVALASAGEPEPAAAVERVRVLARHARVHVLVGEAGGGLLTVLGGLDDQPVPVDAVADALPPGPVVVGPGAADLLTASPSVQEALAGLRAVAGWPGAPRPVPAAELLAERAVLGDDAARCRLLEQVYLPLAAAGGELLQTASAYLEHGTSVEGTARALFLHPNTVRYRLRKIVDVVGRDLTAPRDAQVMQISLVLGRCGVPPTY